jgi:hypothetical protein
MNKAILKITLFLIAFVLINTTAVAQGGHSDHHDDHKTEKAHDEHHADKKEDHKGDAHATGHGDGHADHGHHAHKNHLAVFNGMTYNIDHSSNDFTVGFDYEYRISEGFGMGLGAEYIKASHDEVVLGLPLFFHPGGGAKIVFSPIAVIVMMPESSSADGGSAGHRVRAIAEEPVIEPAHTVTTFGFRIGAAYDHHIGKVSLGPVVNVDVTTSVAVVYGLAIGMGF